MSTALVREIARDHDSAGGLVCAALAVRAVTGLCVLAVGVAASYLMGYDREVRLLISISVLVMVIGQIQDVLASALRGFEEIPLQSAATIVDRILFALLTIALIVMRKPVWMIVGVPGVTSLVSSGLFALALRKKLNWNGGIDLAKARFMIVAGLPFLTQAIFVAIYGQSDAILLSKMSSFSAVGWYNLAKKVAGTSMFVPVAVCSAMLPTLSRLFQSDVAAFERGVKRIVDLVLVALMPFVAMMVLAPDKIFRLFHYPHTFDRAEPVLIILGSVIVLWYVSQVVGTVLTASDRQFVMSRVTGIAALISVPVCALSIWVSQRSLHNGAIGAVASDAIVELYMVSAYLKNLNGMISVGRCVSVLLRAGAASLPMVLLLRMTHTPIGLLWMIPATGIYLLLCVVFQCVDISDLALIRDVASRRPQLPAAPAVTKL
jgi:O-antigen/teichoic acid export membrane protein